MQAILDAVRADPDVYFDSVSQIHLPTWHRGRVALLGDAAHCASPLAGRGTSLAMTGAQFLAEELERSTAWPFGSEPGHHTWRRAGVTARAASSPPSPGTSADSQTRFRPWARSTAAMIVAV